MCVSQHPLPQMGNPLNLCEILDVHVLLTQCHVDIVSIKHVHLTLLLRDLHICTYMPQASTFLWEC